MTVASHSTKTFHTSPALQEFLLTLPPGALAVVPHIRLAHQVWRRQRLQAQNQGRQAWEPVPLATLSGWWYQLWRQLWDPRRLATPYERLVLWLAAMDQTQLPPGVTPDLSWAAALDEAHELCQRYQLPRPADPAREDPLIQWRVAVSDAFADLLAERGLLPPAALPRVLLEALDQNRLSLPEKIYLVALENPAPVEQMWLAAVAQCCPVVQVHLVGPQNNDLDLRGASFPDPRQEMEWVAAQVLERAADKKVPLHRLAITAPNLEDYLPAWRRLWRELLGPAATEDGGWYNFSLGPTLADSSLFAAALLPLRFARGGENREDLIAWLLSPYYGASQRHQQAILLWDRTWRENNIAYGWPALQQACRGAQGAPAGADLLDRVQQALGLLPAGPACASQWRQSLLELWQLLNFPADLDPAPASAWSALQTLLADLDRAAGSRPWTAAELQEWLAWGAGRVDLPGEGSAEAGIQIQGLLELRGLDFDAVYCLGLAMGTFPPPPRPLPLLTSQEKAQVLGGSYQSQYEFAQTSYRFLLAAAPTVVCTYPRTVEEEERLASPILPPDIWPREPIRFAALSHPHPAWRRARAVEAAFTAVRDPAGPLPTEVLPPSWPEALSLSALATALTCPCRFYLAVLLDLAELPETAPGLTPVERGSAVHKVLESFTCRFKKRLEDLGGWDQAAAWEELEAVVRGYQGAGPDDPHLEAEKARWLGQGNGLLATWLKEEQKRYQQGWRWLAEEMFFEGLTLLGWPTTLRGRLDRVDEHPQEGLMLWDYKTGKVPNEKDIKDRRDQVQLPGYILALKQNLTPITPTQQVRAGFIGLKSTRDDHLKFADYRFSAQDWVDIVQARLKEIEQLGQKLRQGDFQPDPCVPPPAPNHSCLYCPFTLLCGYQPPDTGEEEE